MIYMRSIGYQSSSKISLMAWCNHSFSMENDIFLPPPDQSTESCCGPVSQSHLNSKPSIANRLVQNFVQLQDDVYDLFQQRQLCFACNAYLSESLKVGYPLYLLIECEAMAQEGIREIEDSCARIE
ncbi:reverse transcriptase [Actinidia chinensis var. chinensis]|uniref:Reverse transcriptase n=1 Tax=Actinidia chinensis var. chinensis TaxID=1590841 RepID=A0A2R6PWH6_ACTCC|nr:reverse transcriptase [Actinidia chinensis var. chinensis]